MRETLSLLSPRPSATPTYYVQLQRTGYGCTGTHTALAKTGISRFSLGCMAGTSKLYCEGHPQPYATPPVQARWAVRPVGTTGATDESKTAHTTHARRHIMRREGTSCGETARMRTRHCAQEPQRQGLRNLPAHSRQYKKAEPMTAAALWKCAQARAGREEQLATAHVSHQG